MNSFIKSTILLLLVFKQQQPCSSIPFGSMRKKATTEEETQPVVEDNHRDSSSATTTDLNDEKTSIRGAASKVSKEETDIPIVKTYFQTSGVVWNNDDSSTSALLKQELYEMANSETMKEFLKATRRSLHRHPELMYQESFTSEAIQTALTELNIPFTTGWSKNTHPDVIAGPGGYGVVGQIGTGQEPCIILRADMDALPITETTKGIDEFASENKGKMHACGHDGHVTMLLGAAALLKQVEHSIEGTIRLVFQPAEEGGAGAKRMVEEGVVTMDPPAQYAFGMHVWPTLPTGSIASRPGPLLAAAETFEIVLEGKGGHAAMPHLTIDPIVAASSLIVNLQQIVSRTISPLESGVVSITYVSAGDGAFNVIPSRAVIRGTVRALSTEMLMSLRSKVQDMVYATAQLHHLDSDLTTIKFSPDYYPPTVNDADLLEHFSKHVGAMVSREGTLRQDIVPTMGGEDFAFIAQAIPSTFFLVGQGSGGDDMPQHYMPRTDYGLHHPSFALDEEVLPIGVELHANLAIRSLKELAEKKSSEETTQAEEL